MSEYVPVYNQYVAYFKATFPYVAPPTFQEWAINMGINTGIGGNIHSAEKRPQQEIVSRNISQDNELVSPPTTKKVSKRESWSKEQTAILVNTWKSLYKEIETFKQASAWVKVKEAVDKGGPPKSVGQVRKKLTGLKDAYKKAKYNNKQTGVSPLYSSHYHDFDEVLRDIVNMKHMLEVGANNSANGHQKAEHHDLEDKLGMFSSFI